MHIQAPSMNLAIAGLQSAAAAENAAATQRAAAQRAAEVRRNLSDSALRLQAAPEGDEGAVIGQWSDHSRQQRQAPYERSALRSVGSSAEEQAAMPFSLWV